MAAAFELLAGISLWIWADADVGNPGGIEPYRRNVQIDWKRNRRLIYRRPTPAVADFDGIGRFIHLAFSSIRIYIS
jgi:hypothetical protein